MSVHEWLHFVLILSPGFAVGWWWFLRNKRDDPEPIDLEPGNGILVLPDDVRFVPTPPQPPPPPPPVDRLPRMTNLLTTDDKRKGEYYETLDNGMKVYYDR